MDSQINISRYSGLWYELAHFPNWFESGEYATAEYISNGTNLTVINTSYVGDGISNSRVIGRAVVKGPWELGVSFGFPFYAQYKIELVGSDYDYGFSIVGNDSKSQLWILSRSARTSDYFNYLVNAAAYIGYDTSKLIVNHRLINN